MKNSTEKTGERIRTERLRNNLTQFELADGKISRNMLSMIESGRATPSLETVVDIANKLEIPVGMLLAGDSSAEALYSKIYTVSKAKALFSEKRYSDCIDICSSAPFDDEMTALMAECYLKSAEDDIRKCMLASASRNLKSAAEISGNTVYLDESFIGTVNVYNFMISCAGGKINDERLAKLFRSKSRIGPAILVYLSILSKIDKRNFEFLNKTADFFPFLTKEECNYLKAKKEICEFRFSSALEILLQFENNENIDFITKYRILADIELCYENRRDFESAYKYATLKHRLLECFKN